MTRLRLYQDTFFFFLLAFLTLGAGILLFGSQNNPSYPLPAIHLESQEDGDLIPESG